MADVTRLPGVFEQMWLIGGLRWRILKNGLRRKHNFWDLIAMIWVAFLSGCIVIGVSGGFYAGGYAFVAKNDAQWFLLLFWLIFLWWQIFPLFVAGFGSTFEFSTLLRFPMSRRAFYLLGLGYGFSDFAAISSTCWIIAMVAGAATARWNIVPALIAASALFVLLNVTLERLIGSWVEKILAKRRSREIFLGVFILGMVSLNFLNPALHQMGPQTKQVLLQYLPYLSWFPGSLAGNSIGAALAADSRSALRGIGGLLAWLAGLSALLWQRFSTQYSGEEISDSAAPAVRSKRERKLELGAETIGWLAPQVTAVVVKEFRYLTRNGFASSRCSFRRSC